MIKKNKEYLVLVAFIVILLLSVVISLGLGRYPLKIADILGIIGFRLESLWAELTTTAIAVNQGSFLANYLPGFIYGLNLIIYTYSIRKESWAMKGRKNFILLLISIFMGILLIPAGEGWSLLWLFWITVSIIMTWRYLSKRKPKKVNFWQRFLLLIIVIFLFFNLLILLNHQVVTPEPLDLQRMEMVLYSVRLPRIIMAILVGSALSIAGASFQGIFQNPMAAPDILGASSGASFGAALAIILGLSFQTVTVVAFLVSIGAVFLVYIISKKAKGSRILGLVLTGVMVSSLFSAGTSYLKLVADPASQLPSITYWLMGSFSGITMNDVQMVFLPIALGMIPLIIFRWQINVLTMGEEEAHTLGIHTTRIRLMTIVCATLVTAASISITGIIGWVGLVIPNLSRRIVGNDYRFLMPVSMVFGGVFLLWVDDIARNLWTSEIPIGILTAFVGAPFFLYLITREGSVGNE